MVTTPLGRALCTALHHRRARRTAHVVVSFGPAAEERPSALFVGCWGRCFPLRRQCWEDTRQIAQHWPGLRIYDATRY